MELEPWEAWSPTDIAERLHGVGTRWAVAGGWAIDLFVGHVAREHDDIELAVGPGGFAIVRCALTELDWFAVGSGTITAFDTAAAGVIDRTWQTWGWDPGIGAWRIDVMREPWTGDAWRYRRDPRISAPLDDAIRVTPDGIPYLSPEIVLLFKAKHCRDKDEDDFARSVPLIEARRIEWLIAALEAQRPAHPWLVPLRARLE